MSDCSRAFVMASIVWLGEAQGHIKPLLANSFHCFFLFFFFPHPVFPFDNVDVKIRGNCCNDGWRNVSLLCVHVLAACAYCEFFVDFYKPHTVPKKRPFLILNNFRTNFSNCAWDWCLFSWVCSSYIGFRALFISFWGNVEGNITVHFNAEVMCG